MEGSSSKGPTIESIIEGGGKTLKEIKVEGKTNKFERDENSNDHSKFKKVEMPVFSGTDVYKRQCLFRMDWNLQVHKSMDSKKLLNP